MKKIILLLITLLAFSCSQEEPIENHSLEQDTILNEKNLIGSSVPIFLNKADHRAYLESNSALFYLFSYNDPQHIPYLQGLIHPINNTISMAVLYDESLNPNFTSDFKTYYWDHYNYCISPKPDVTENPPPPFKVIPPKSSNLNSGSFGLLIYNTYKTFNIQNQTEIFLPNGISYTGNEDVYSLGHPLNDVDSALGILTYGTPRSILIGLQAGTGDLAYMTCFGEHTIISIINVTNQDFIILSRPIKNTGLVPLHPYIDFDIETYLGNNTSHGPNNTHLNL